LKNETVLHLHADSNVTLSSYSQ